MTQKNKTDGKNQHPNSKELRRLQNLEAVSRLAGGIIHDLNNKLMVINANINMITKQITGDPKISRRLLATAVATEQASLIVSQMMHLFNPRDTSPRYIKVDEALISVVNLLQRSLISRNIQVETSINDATSYISVNSDEFQSALVNIAVWLGDQMPEGGLISISASPVSLASKQIEKIEEGGSFIKITFLGLIYSQSSNAKSITEDQWKFAPMIQPTEFVTETGGGLCVEKIHDEQLAIVMYLPEATVPVVLGKEEPFDEFTSQLGEVLDNSNTKGSEILIVDDEIEVALALQNIIKDIGYVTRIAIGAKEAAEAIVKQRPSMVLSDIAMKGVSGIALAHEIRDVFPNLPIILITGDQRLKQDDVEFPLLLKPINSEKLAKEIHKNLLHGVSKNIIPLKP